MEENYKKKLTANRSYLLGARYFNALKALEFSRAIHNGNRKDGSPEFIHQLTMNQFNFNLRLELLHPEETISTIYLHDAPEENHTSHEIIKAKFGDIVGGAVYLMDKHRFSPRILSPEEYHEPMAECPIASIAKSIDRCHNLATMMRAFSKAKQIEYVTETEEHVMPMLKQAFYNFPEQASAYGIMRHTLRLELDLLKYTLKMQF